MTPEAPPFRAADRKAICQDNNRAQLSGKRLLRISGAS
jgi:hypothetical protein